MAKECGNRAAHGMIARLSASNTPYVLPFAGSSFYCGVALVAGGFQVPIFPSSNSVENFGCQELGFVRRMIVHPNWETCAASVI